MPGLGDRVLIHLADGRRQPIDPAGVYYLEAIEGATRLGSRSSRLVVDVCPKIAEGAKDRESPSDNPEQGATPGSRQSATRAEGAPARPP